MWARRIGPGEGAYLYGLRKPPAWSDYAPGGIFRSGERRPVSATNTKHRVLVFTTPTCSWCTRVKAYLRENRVQFREIDVSRDQKAADNLVRKTGQMGVPVVEIDGRPIVGFDKQRIDALLGLRAR